MSLAFGSIGALMLPVVLVMALLPCPAAADEATVPRIAVLARLTTSSIEEGVRAGLRELGYTEGKNLVVDWRRTKGGADEWSLAADLVHSKVDVLVVFNTGSARAALDASSTVPVVFISGDPVGTGLAESLSKPGRNATGVSVLSTDLFPKRLEYLHWLAPKARQIAFLTNSTNPIAPPSREATKKAADLLGVKLVILDVRNEAELDTALRELRRGAADGVIVAGDALLFSNRSKLIDGIRKARRPAIFPYVHDCDLNVLMCYGPNMMEVGRKLATYADRILKGARPADLPMSRSQTMNL